MVNKYARHLENRDINSKTGAIWTINDVPATWRGRVEEKILEDGYFVEEDGTVSKKEEETVTPKKGRKKSS